MKNSKLGRLSQEDRATVIQLCDQHPYEHVVELLALPRPEGLGLSTSKSALSRFYNQYHRDTQDQFATIQLAQTTEPDFEKNEKIYLAATIAVLQQRIFRALSNRQPFSEIAPMFRAMLELRHEYLALRKQSHSGLGVLGPSFFSSLQHPTMSESAPTPQKVAPHDHGHSRSTAGPTTPLSSKSTSVEPAATAHAKATPVAPRPVEITGCVPHNPTENPRNPAFPAQSTPSKSHQNAQIRRLNDDSECSGPTPSAAISVFPFDRAPGA